MIELSDLEYIFDHQTIDGYKANEEHLKTADWNNRANKLLHIAFYIILHKPEPKLDIKEKRLLQIRKTVSETKLKILKGKVKRLSSELFEEAYDDNGFYDTTFHELNLEGRLGKYAKYFIRESKAPHSKDIENKYIFQEGVHALNCANAAEDEIQIIKDFLDHVEEEKDSYIKLYQDVRAYNQNTQKPALKPSDIDESLKTNLTKRLSRLNLKDAKLNRILSSTMKAIKKELLQLK